MKQKTMVSGIVILILVISSIVYYMNTRPIYIGFGAGLSGQWSQLGVQVRNGFLQAVEDVNESGGINGRKVVPVIFDDKNDNEYAKTLLQELKNKKIKYFMGFAISAMTPTIEYFMEQSDMLIISPTMSTNLLTGRDDFFFRICNASAGEAYSILEILQAEKFNDFAIVHDESNSQYTGPTHDIIVDSVEEYGLNLVYDEAFDSHSVDYAAMAKRIHESGANQVVIQASGVDTAEIAQMLRLIDNDAILYANAWATTNDLLENGGKTVNEMRVVGLYDISSKDPDYLEFEKKMVEQYGDKPTFPQIFGYESLVILRDAMSIAGTEDVDKVKQTLIEVGEFKGLQQMIDFDEFGDAQRKNFIYEVRDGEFKSLDK